MFIRAEFTPGYIPRKDVGGVDFVLPTILGERVGGESMTFDLDGILGKDWHLLLEEHEFGDGESIGLASLSYGLFRWEARVRRSGLHQGQSITEPFAQIPAYMTRWTDVTGEDNRPVEVMVVNLVMSDAKR